MSKARSINRPEPLQFRWGNARPAMVLRWVDSKLSRKLLVGLAVIIVASSAVFLALFVTIYRDQLEQERSNASAQVNRLLQVALENAMLKRDLPGLRDIVDRLGQQPGIEDVIIINPRREVRFASNPSMLGRKMTMGELGCPDCGAQVSNLPTLAHFVITDADDDVLRSVNPIRNKPACRSCHGVVSKSPINGILIVDQEASGIRNQAFAGAMMLSGAGFLVVALALSGTWVLLRRTVLAPVNSLNRASNALASGNMDARVEIESRNRGADELNQLFRSFNTMADQLQSSLDGAREQRAFLQALIDAVPDGIRVIDANYMVVMANRAYCEQMASEADEAIGVPCYRAHGRTEPCQPTLVTCPLQADWTGRQTLKYIHSHVSEDGREVHAETVAARLSTAEGQASRALFVEAIRDMGQQVKFSQEQRLAELGTLGTGVAHEIYNPLASVRIGLQSILKRIRDGDDNDEEISKYLKTVDGEVDKCISITKRLLDLSLPPSKSPQLVSFDTIVPEVLSLLRYEAQKGGIEVSIDLGETELRVVATDSELRMLILNLVQNAFHAMPQGGELSIAGHVNGIWAEIEIRDTGVGIATDDLPLIYHPFFSRRADEVEGTGLGLTIARAIAERYGGRLEVRSTVGEGTAFTVRMPLASDEEGQP